LAQGSVFVGRLSLISTDFFGGLLRRFYRGRPRRGPCAVFALRNKRRRGRTLFVLRDGLRHFYGRGRERWRSSGSPSCAGLRFSAQPLAAGAVVNDGNRCRSLGEGDGGGKNAGYVRNKRGKRNLSSNVAAQDERMDVFYGADFALPCGDESGSMAREIEEKPGPGL